MTVVSDWRLADSSEVAPLIDDEARLWLSELHWDVADSWHVIEPARGAGQLPGLLARDGTGRPIGWAAYLRHGTSVQVMTLVAPTVEVTRAMVDTMLASDEARTAEVAIVCVRDTSRGIAEAFAAHGFTVEPYRYLAAPIGDENTVLHHQGDRDQAFAPWPGSNDGVARLFARAYAGESTVRAFAPHGSHEEWIEYLDQLRKGPGCGWFRPDLSLVAPGDTDVSVDAAVLVTQLSPSTVHIAQLAVDPAARRRGLARQIVTAALARAASRYTRATLLVSAGNQAAGALYGSLGFTELARFVVATRR